MDFHDLLPEEHTIDVPFGPHRVSVTYRVAERAYGKVVHDDDLGEALVRQVVRWDLTDGSEPVPITIEGIGPVPTPVLRRIWQAIVAADPVGEASGS